MSQGKAPPYMGPGGLQTTGNAGHGQKGKPLFSYGRGQLRARAGGIGHAHCGTAGPVPAYRQWCSARLTSNSPVVTCGWNALQTHMHRQCHPRARFHPRRSPAGGFLTPTNRAPWGGLSPVCRVFFMGTRGFRTAQRSLRCVRVRRHGFCS